MSDLFDALLDPRVAFLRYAFIAGLLASVSFGIMGSYVVARRISYIAGAISHSVLGGIGAAIYLRHGLGYVWCDPLYGATAAALLSALIIGFASLYAGEREDTVIGAVWAVGMAIGLLCLYKTPGNYDPMSYLFGNILLISQRDLWLVIGSIRWYWASASSSTTSSWPFVLMRSSRGCAACASRPITSCCYA